MSNRRNIDSSVKMNYYCNICNEHFTDEDLYTCHVELYHNVSDDRLFDCEDYPVLENFLGDSEVSTQQERPSVIAYAPPREQRFLESENSNRLGVEVMAEAFETSIVRHYRINNINALDLQVFLNRVKDVVLEKLKYELTRLNFIKFGLLLDTTFNNIEGETSNRGFISRNRSIMETSDLEPLVQECLQELILKITEHEARGSGWSLLTVNSLDLRVHKRGYGDRGSSFIPLPKKIKDTKSCINVQNNDNECFKYSMLAKFLVNEEANNIFRPNKRYQELTYKYNFTGLTYPVSLADVQRFEKRNSGVSVNVFGLDNKSNVYPLKVVSRELADHTDLLLITDDKISHYVYIKDFNRLVHKQLTKKIE